MIIANNSFADTWKVSGAAAMCRMDRSFLASLSSPEKQVQVIVCACSAVILGTFSYGFVFGIWHSYTQALYSAIKMPILFFTVILSSALINTMLAQVLGAELSMRQVCMAMLIGMAITAVLLGALSPVALFLVFQVPWASAQDANASMGAYWIILLTHVLIIGFCGLVGNIKLYSLLIGILNNRKIACRLLVIWLLVSGFVGCELSWMLSPFLCKPTQPAHVFPREYFEQNFYERVWYAVKEAV